MIKTKWVITCWLLAIVVFASCASSVTGYEIGIKDRIFNVDLALTPEQQALGLGGRDSLADNEGMLFIYDRPAANRIFWMKGMVFPIDIIWINTGRIVHIVRSAPPPTEDMPERVYPRYGQGIIADSVLELRAGTTDDLDLKVGDTVNY